MSYNFMKLLRTNRLFSREVTLTFLFKDLAFLLLPLGILFPVNLFFGKSTPLQIIASTNFTFVTMVLLATTMTNFIDLKIKIQKDINYKLFEGLKLYILFLIGSAIVLTINLLNELSITGSHINELSFAIANGILFLFGIFTLFLKVLTEIGHKYFFNMIHEFKTRKGIVEIIFNETSEIKDKITHLLYTVECFEIDPEIDNKSEFDYFHFQKISEEKIVNVNRMIEDTEKNIQNIKNKLKERRNELEQSDYQEKVVQLN